ncbi:hypothetical protein BLA60_37615 [Actinophytocola xinjiangensis]|uniref:ABC-2 family transporter n=1 Tax=Actinophytocola xinjiangensis TaxID=485602 RepID=A0A7Z1AU26_9PSEU|nr:ABC transporter permease subunit [Actinophytocola xinjiangensis]OLF05101.1 hypothetical protein BLA60_37615 [Actinophytocola xinjiangensis]
MTWLALRQFRAAGAAMAAVVLVLVAVLLATGLGTTDYTQLDVVYTVTLIGVTALPVLIAIFVAVPMVTRELETGTHSLVWNQTVTRKRWLATKFAVGLPAAVVAAGALSLAATWWAGPLDAQDAWNADAVPPRISPAVFMARGLAPFGYAAFAYALGIAVAVLVRRTVAAMALTLVLFVAVQLAVPFLVRPYLLAPVEETVAITEANVGEIRGTPDGLESVGVIEPDRAWTLTNETVDAQGAAVGSLREVAGLGCLTGPQPVPPAHESLVGCLVRLDELGYQQRLVYHPDSHFWALHGIEAGFFLALSALLAWFSFRRINHLS